MAFDAVSQYKDQFIRGEESPASIVFNLQMLPNAKEITALFLASLLNDNTAATHPDLCLKVICAITGDSTQSKEFQAFAIALIKAEVIKPHSEEVQSIFAKACKANNEDLAKKLLDVGIDSRLLDSEGTSPLEYASQYGMVHVLSRMLDQSRSAASPLNLGSALRQAVFSSSEQTIELLLKHGAKIKEVDNRGDSVLHIAITSGCDPQFFDFLIKKGAPLDAANKEGVTPLLACIEEKNTPLAERLISGGANVDLQDKRGLYPLEVAQQAKREDIAALFTQGKAVDRQLVATMRTYKEKLSLSPPLPKQGINDPRSPVNKRQLDTFIQKHSDDQLRSALREMVDHTEHVSFDAFSESLSTVIDHLNSEIPKGEEYIIVVEPGKSNKWLAELALPKLSELPKDVVRMHDLKSAMEKHPNVRRVVFFDDASYSGSQMCTFIREYAVKGFEHLGRQDFVVHVAVPYHTEFAKERIEKINKDPGVAGKGAILVAPHKIMPAASEQVSKEHALILNPNYFSKTLTPHFAILNEESMQLSASDVEILCRFGFDRSLLLSYEQMISSLEEKHPNFLKLTNQAQLQIISENPAIEEAAKKVVDALAAFYASSKEKLHQEKSSSQKVEDFISKMENCFSKCKNVVTNDKGLSSRTLTVFDHKVADEFSTCPGYQFGHVIEMGKYVGIVPNLFPGYPPYKAKY